jgi:hypothetical protein
MASCTTDENPATFQGEPLIAGADPEAVVRTIDLPDYPAVFLLHEKGAVNIGIFQPKTGSPVLQLRDDNYVDGSWHEVEGIGTQDVTVLLDGKRVALKEIVTTLGRPK